LTNPTVRHPDLPDTQHLSNHTPLTRAKVSMLSPSKHEFVEA